VSAKQIVIDASAALKWRLRDEEATAQADALLDDFLAGDVELITPTLFDYEITNALKVAAVRGRISESDAADAITDFQELEIKRRDFAEVQTLAFQLACQFQRSAYDSAYVALAQANGIWFYTGDRRLFNALGKQLPWVKWIGDYRLDLVPTT